MKRPDAGGVPKSATAYYVCDVCSLRFKAAPGEGEPERCVRCHTPFIHRIAPRGEKPGHAPERPRCLAFT